MWQIKHGGLYLGHDQIAVAEQHRAREPFKAAWELLMGGVPASSDPDDLRYLHLLWNSLLAFFMGDSAGAASAIHALHDEPLLIYIPPDQPYLLTVSQSLVVAQCFEMLRGHSDWNPEVQTRWLEAFAGLVTELLADANEDGETIERSFIETIWGGLLAVAAGIVLEDEPLFDAGAAIYRRVIDESIRPQGHIPEVVENPDGFHQLLWAVNGLTLMAEAAAQVGVDLWGYTNRGVSVVTAGLYPLYFYYYAEKWPWGDPLPMEEVQALFRQHSGYLEMLNRHIGRPTKAIDLILKEIRPVFDLYDGGLTTLTHAAAPRRGLFG